MLLDAARGQDHERILLELRRDLGLREIDEVWSVLGQQPLTVYVSPVQSLRLPRCAAAWRASRRCTRRSLTACPCARSTQRGVDHRDRDVAVVRA